MNIDLTNPVVSSLQNVWLVIARVTPVILGATIVFLIGLILAKFCEIITDKIIKGIKLDKLLKSAGFEEFLKRGDLKLDSGKFLGALIYWFVVIVFTFAASEILGFKAFTVFLEEIANYTPNIIIAVLIVLVTIIVAEFSKKLVKSSIKSVKMSGANFLSALTWWTIIIFGIASALIQLKIAASLINAILIGFIAMISLAGGIAFGLGGKEYASHLVEKIKETFEK